MNSKADTLADLIYKAVQPAGALTAFRTYLDLYADVRAMDREKEAADRLFAGEALCQNAAPLLTLNGRNEYKFDGDEGNAEDVDDEPAAEQRKTTGNEHVFVGKGAAEKRDVYNRLIAYKESHGPGCMVTLSKATGGKITDDRLRVMAGSGCVPLNYWLLLGKTLDKIEKEENACLTTTNAPTAECSSTPEKSATAAE